MKSKYTVDTENGARFAKGNQAWQQRSKHGRNTLFESPELLLEAAAEYFKYCDSHPMFDYKPMVVDKAVEIVKVPVRIPYTMIGLVGYLGCSTNYFKEFKQRKEACTPEFMAVIVGIENIIQNQQLVGAAIGHFNSNIVARLLGLVDKTEVTSKVITIEQDGEETVNDKNDEE